MKFENISTLKFEEVSSENSTKQVVVQIKQKGEFHLDENLPKELVEMIQYNRIILLDFKEDTLKSLIFNILMGEKEKTSLTREEVYIFRDILSTELERMEVLRDNDISKVKLGEPRFQPDAYIRYKILYIELQQWLLSGVVELDFAEVSKEGLEEELPFT